MLKIITVVGNPKVSSRTLRVAERIAERLARQVGGEQVASIDLAEFSDALLDWTSPVVDELIEKVMMSDLLVIASPTFKATYTGLLKVFLDRFNAGSLLGRCAVPVMVAGAPHHGLAVETSLRPLLVELGATCITPGLCVLENELDNLDETIESWWTKAEASLRAIWRLGGTLGNET